MNDTVFRPSGGLLYRVSPSSAPERGQVDDTVARLAGGIEGHASLFTTTADMARFARLMMNGGELDGVRVLKTETIKLMTSVQSPPDLRSPDAKNLPVQRGLGWDIHTPYRTPPHDYTLARGALFPIGSYGHTGWTGQMLWIDPASRTFVIFLCNRYGPSGKDTRAEVYRLHHRIATLTAEAVKGFDFTKASSRSATTSAATFTNSLGMKFVSLPGTHTLMCVHETRRSDYAAYAATNPQADASWKDTKLESLSASAADDHPVVNVSWDDAKAFCAWLSQKEGLVYRLPTDREWSIAVGIADREAGDTTPEKLSGKVKNVYPWGTAWPPAKGAGNYADTDCKTQLPTEKIIASYTDGFAITSPVMSFPANALGIHDLGGSVWEWCEDFFNETHKDHVLRGASWGSSAPVPLLSSFRGNQPSTRRWRCDGFRCVVEQGAK
jgi:formylglycine-generating enzyme required for sulfatase activity